jgi:hypothetical protein
MSDLDDNLSLLSLASQDEADNINSEDHNIAEEAEASDSLSTDEDEDEDEDEYEDEDSYTLSNEDVLLRYNLSKSIQEVELALQRDPNLIELVRSDFNRGLISTDDVDKLFTEEELAMERPQLFAKLLRDYCVSEWKTLSPITREQATKLFASVGMDLFPDIDEPEEGRKNHITILKNVHAICSKYYIEDDDYNYNFNPDGNNPFDPTKDYCLSIGSCSFFPVFQNDGFPYHVYVKMLDKHIIVDGVPPLVFNPSLGAIPGDLIDEMTEEEEAMLLGGDWIKPCGFTENFDPVACEKTLTNPDLVIPPSEIRIRAQQAAMVENLNENEYCILSFPQYQRISGFLLRTKSMIGKRARVLKKLGGYVLVKHLTCKFGTAPDCTRGMTMVVDSLHRIVLLRPHGRHHPTNCKKKNRINCLPAYRNIFVANNQGNKPTETFEYVQTKYLKVFNIVYDLGIYPSTSSLNSWIRNSRQDDSPISLPPAIFKDYNSCCALLKSELAENRVLTRKDTTGFMTVPIDEQSIIHSFDYADDSKTKSGMLYSSKKSLEALASATWWSVDTTCNMLHDGRIKFITVSFKRIRTGYKSQVFLGAIATLPGRESTQNYTTFFQELLKLIATYVPSTLQLKTVIIDESRTEMRGISEAFDSEVEVVNCIWHKGLTFEKHVNCYGANVLRTALNATTETDFFAIFASLALTFDRRYHELGSKINASRNSSRVPEKYKWFYYSRDRSMEAPVRKVKELPLEDAQSEFHKMIAYLHKLWITRKKWALFARDGMQQYEATLLSSRSKTVEDGLKSKYPMYGKGKECCQQTIMRIIRSHNIVYRHDPTDTYTDFAIRELIIEGEHEDSEIDLKGLEMAKSLQGTAFSTQASETMHDSLKHNHKIKNMPTLFDLTDKFKSYFMQQDSRLLQLPPRECPLKNISGMWYLTKIDDAQAHVFIKEHKVVHDKGLQLNMKDLLEMLETKILDRNGVKACHTCSVCIALRVPCRHTMANLLYHMLTRVRGLTETSKRNIVKYGFVKRLDEMLMEYYYPRTWSKSNRDLKGAKQQDDGNESSGESEVGIDGSSDESDQFDDIENDMDAIPGTTVGDNYAMTQELRYSLGDYLEEWTIRDPDSPELLNYRKQCAILLKSISGGQYKTHLDLSGN